MNTTLRRAQSQMRRLKKQAEMNGYTNITLVLRFERSIEDTKHIIGAEAFYEVLEQVGGTYSEKNITEACKRSGLCRESVCIRKKTIEDHYLKIHCTNSQARALLARVND